MAHYSKSFNVNSRGVPLVFRSTADLTGVSVEAYAGDRESSRALTAMLDPSDPTRVLVYPDGIPFGSPVYCEVWLSSGPDVMRAYPPAGDTLLLEPHLNVGPANG